MNFLRGGCGRHSPTYLILLFLLPKGGQIGQNMPIFIILEKLDQLNHHLDALMKGISEKDAITMNQLLDQLREVSK